MAPKSERRGVSPTSVGSVHRSATPGCRASKLGSHGADPPFVGRRSAEHRRDRYRLWLVRPGPDRAADPTRMVSLRHPDIRRTTPPYSIISRVRHPDQTKHLHDRARLETSSRRATTETEPPTGTRRLSDQCVAEQRNQGRRTSRRTKRTNQKYRLWAQYGRR
jgi:hypothetical protein